MNDQIQKDETVNQPKETLDPSRFAGDVLIYSRENRIDINVFQKDFYYPNSNGSLYLFISPQLLPSEARKLIDEKGLSSDPKFEAITQLYEKHAPDDLSFKVTINTSGAVIPRKYLPDSGQLISQYLKFGFNKEKGGVYFESDLTDEQAIFILGLINNSFTDLLGKVRSGADMGETPPRLRHDPLHMLLTDKQFDEQVPGMYVKSTDVEKIKKQRDQTIAQIKYIQLTMKEIITKQNKDN